VSDLQASLDFYRKTMGFDLVMRFGPSAAFLAAGGYHHHVGLNTWAGTGLPPAPPKATGLVWFAIEMPDQKSYREQLDRLESIAAEVRDHELGLMIDDPSGITILLKASA
jgi:catechol 2,3-dioxygenase